MREFLAGTRYCDVSAKAIGATASLVCKDEAAAVDRAVKLFEFVRDHVLYAFSEWNITASQTLVRRRGMCTNKANLLIALLRASGIPAAYGVLVVNPREYFGVVAPPFLKPMVGNRSLHIYVAAYLQDQWVRCDPSTDADIARRTSHYCRQTRLVEWDGLQDALDFLQPQHVYEDAGLHSDVDRILDKPAKHATPETLEVINRYVRFIREHPPFATAHELIRSYLDSRTPDRATTAPPRPDHGCPPTEPC